MQLRQQGRNESLICSVMSRVQAVAGQPAQGRAAWAWQGKWEGAQGRECRHGKADGGVHWAEQLRDNKADDGVHRAWLLWGRSPRRVPARVQTPAGSGGAKCTGSSVSSMSMTASPPCLHMFGAPDPHAGHGAHNEWLFSSRLMMASWPCWQASRSAQVPVLSRAPASALAATSSCKACTCQVGLSS